MAEPDSKRPRVILKGKTTAGEANGGNGNSSVHAIPEARLRSVPAGPQAHTAAVTRFRTPVQRTPDGGALAIFDVGGKIFKVPAQLVRSKPGTRLAQLLDNAGESSPASTASKPIFVDAAPERFTCILDWYRFGELHVPKSIPIAALLQDARNLQLPEELVINGILRNTRSNAAHRVGRDLVSQIIEHWSGFSIFLQATLEKIRLHYHAVGERASLFNTATIHDGEAEEAYDFSPFVLALYGEKGWLNTDQVCSAARARVLALKLEEHGYRCDFTETELVVSLPLRLRGEGGVVGNEEEELPVDDGGGADGEGY